MKLKEKYDALKTSHHELMDRCNYLENKLKNSNDVGDWVILFTLVLMYLTVIVLPIILFVL